MRTAELPNHEVHKQVPPAELYDVPPAAALAELTAEADGHTAEPLGSISLRETLKVDWGTVEKVAEPYKWGALNLAERWGTYTPAVAGAIVKAKEPTYEYIGPTAAQIKEEHLGPRLISGFLSFLSPSWGARFDSYLERRARQRIERVAYMAVKPLDVIESVDNPKIQFVNELKDMYERAQTQDTEDTEDLEGGTEDKVPELMRRVAGWPHSHEETKKASERYPLLGRLLPTLGARNSHILEKRRTVRAVSPEIMKGVERFLKTRDASVRAAQFEPFRSLTRRVILRVAPGRLAKVPGEVETMLTHMYEILPADGKKFTESVYALCEKVSDLAREGVDGQAITKALLKDLWRK